VCTGDGTYLPECTVTSHKTVTFIFATKDPQVSSSDNDFLFWLDLITLIRGTTNAGSIDC
jgi:hypothetical protein